jgi:nucleoside permease NupC
MVGGFATVSGSTLAAYVGFGVSANNLIIASLMAAPGGLVISKTLFPETFKTNANWDAIKNLPKSEANTSFEAFCIGASNMCRPVALILANLIAFTSFFTFLDSVVAWFFSLLLIENFGISGILKYAFFPFALLMVKLNSIHFLISNVN